MSELKAVFVGFYRGEYGGKVISCLLVDKSGVVLSRGLSICLPPNRFDKTAGKLRAFGRAMKILENPDNPRASWKIKRPVVHGALVDVGLFRVIKDRGITQCHVPKTKAEIDPLLSVPEMEAVIAWRKRNLLIDNNGLFTGPKEPCKEPIKKSKSCECEPCTCAEPVSINSTITMVNHELHP